MSDDFDLLDAWGAGDNDAARQLLTRYTPPLYRFFERSLVGGSIEDFVQETLTRAIEGRARCNRSATFKSYLFGIARHVLFAELRLRYRGGGDLDLASSSLRDLAASPSQVAAAKDEHALLVEALRWQPVETQLLLELYYWQKLSAREIADAWGMGEPAIRGRLRRAIKALRETIERVASSPAMLESTWSAFERQGPALPDDDEKD
jgi:RNA polymerase sigma-70 factor (ECF subfamily)